MHGWHQNHTIIIISEGETEIRIILTQMHWELHINNEIYLNHIIDFLIFLRL